MKNAKKIFELIGVVSLATVSAIMYATIIFPNSFAPSGMDGICTMIQDILGVSMGYLTFVVNIPLLIFAWIFLSKDFCVKTTLYVLVFSVVSVMLKEVDITRFCYHTTNGTSTVLSPIAGGSIRGIIYVMCIGLNASSGGVDIIASLIKRAKPHINFMVAIFAINMLVALCSYFVYGFKIEPVICSIIYSFVCSATSNSIRHSKTETVKFEIITSDTREVLDEISSKLHQRATIMDAKGAYSKTDKKLIICVADKPSAADIEKFLVSREDTIYFKSVVNNGVL